MAKFSGPSVLPGAQAELPTGPAQPAASDFSELLGLSQQPEAAPAQIPTAPAPEAAQGAPEAQQQAFEAEVSQAEAENLNNIALSQEQRARERVPAIGEKLGVGSLAGYVAKQDDPLMGVMNRSDNVSNLLQYGGESYLRATPVGKRAEALKAGAPEAAFARQDAEGNLIQPEYSTLKGGSAAIGASSVLYDPRVLDAGVVKEDGYIGVDPEFSAIMSLATETWLYQESQGEGTTIDDAPELGTDPDAVRQVEGVKPQSVEISKSKGNQQLGREVYRQWKRQKALLEGRPTDEYVAEESNINPDTFTFIGDMAKEVYAEANPNILFRPPNAKEEDGQVYFQLTPEGVAELDRVNTATMGLFAQAEVQPLTAVSPTAQPVYEAQTRVRPVTTKVGDLKDWSQVQESMANYHGVKYVNDPQREGLAMQFAILGLLNHSQDNVWANMFDLGAERLQSVEGNRMKMIDEASREQDPDVRGKLERDAQRYNPQKVMAQDREKFLNIMGGLAQYSGRANHVTFSMQGLTGRTHIQQTRYNPQAHKPVRFVVGGGNVYTWKPGSGAIDRNFREIMAAHFVKDARGTGGKDLATEGRLKEFEQQLRSGQLDQYIAWGKELIAAQQGFDTKGAMEAFKAISNANTVEEVNKIKQDVQAKYSNDPYSDGLKAELAKHGDEGPYTAEAMMELAKYSDAMKNGTPMSSSINVEMDGKTHGPATNAALLGVKGMAERTGLIRTQDYTLTDEIDSRKAMGEWMLEMGPSFSGTLFPQEKFNAYNSILEAAVKDRGNFLKKSPMTMGYGQELGSLKMHVETTVYNGPQSGVIQDIIKSDPDLNINDVINFLHTMLVDSIYHVMDPKVVEMSRLLRANNLVATLTDEVLWMENAMGFRSYAAAKQSQPEERGQAGYEFVKDGKREGRTASFYREQAAGSAVRKYKEGEAPVPGGFGHGRVIPIAVQSYDGNMISRTGSGTSWDRVSKTSKGRGGSNPFVLPIFDAFKTDLGSFDVVREEANRNWVNGMRNHSYVTSIMGDWYKETTQKFTADMKAQDPNAMQDVNMDTKWRGLYYFFNETDDNGNPRLQGLLKKVMHAAPKEQGVTIDEYDKQLGRMAKKMMANIHKRMDSRGIPHRFDQLTNKQILDLVGIIAHELGIGERNRSTVNRIQADKSKLFDAYARQGREARQVDIA